jgi:hypothetical protein
MLCSQVSGYAWDNTEQWFVEMYGRVIDTILSLGELLTEHKE